VQSASDEVAVFDPREEEDFEVPEEQPSSVEPGPQGGYRYRNEKIAIIWVSSVPQTDTEAIAYMWVLRGWGFNPVYLERRRPGERTWEMIPLG